MNKNGIITIVVLLFPAITVFLFFPSSFCISQESTCSLLDIEPFDDELKKARLVFGGDLMLHSPQVTAARQPNGDYDFSETFRYVKPFFEEADLSIVNFETTISTSTVYSGYPMFRSPEKVAEAVKNAGIDVVVLANNHALDGHKNGVIHTQKIFDCLGIKHTGIFTDSIKYAEEHPLLLEANGLKIALLNYTYGTNGLPVPEGIKINMLDSATIHHDIEQIDRRDIDVVIVFLHWGDEYARMPNSVQKSIAEMCHRIGAEIVIGSHPHVVQTIEGTDEWITVYSLGNLVSNQRKRYRDGGIIVTLDLYKEKDMPLKVYTSYMPVWVKLPKYQILPPKVADTIQMDVKQQVDYKTFIDDTDKLLGGF